MKVRNFVLALGIVVISALTGTVSVHASDNEVTKGTITHSHISNSTTGGGCYTTPHNVDYGRQKKTRNISCGSSSWTEVSSYVDSKTGVTIHTWRCSRGHSYTGSVCTSNCGVTTGTQDYYVCKKCGKESCNGIHQEGWDLDCGMTDGQVLGTYSMLKNITPPNYILSVSTEAGSATVKSYAWNTGATGSSINVTGDGLYTCTVTVNDGYKDRTCVLSYTVSDYDKEPPVISSVEYSKVRTVSSVDIVVNATDDMTGVAGYLLEKN